MHIRPRRSVLYMPGSNPRALDKAQQLAADCLIFDLEDAVAPEAKSEARDIICQAISCNDYGSREVVVRVNGLDTEWGAADLQAMACSGADAICLPKVERAMDVTEALRIMDEAGAPATMTLWVMAETPRGILQVEEVCAASERISVLMMGTSDLAKDLRVRHTPDRIGFITSLGLCVLAARSQGLDIIDGVQLNLNDESVYLQSCQQGRDLGFDGKSLIHPKQIEIANQVFGPSEEEIQRAEKVIDAWRQAESEGKAVVLVDGRLVESLHVEEARRCLAIAEAIAAQ